MIWGENLYFFFQAEDGIRDAQESRGLGDVYKRQTQVLRGQTRIISIISTWVGGTIGETMTVMASMILSLIHI